VANVAGLRASLAAFAEAAGRPLTAWQLEDLQLDSPIACLLWARQMGKSRGLATLGVWSAFRTPGSGVLVVSGGGDLGARRVLAEVRSVVTGSELLRASVDDEQTERLVLSNGSRLRCVAASETAVRGWSADLLILDEAQLLSEALVAAAMPVVAAREGARVLLAGTASSASGPFFDLFRAGQSGDAHVRSSVRVSRLVGGPDKTPWVQASIIEAQRAAMSPWRFAAEYECVWQSESNAAFTRAAWERVLVDTPLLAPSEVRPPARVNAGADRGATNDQSAIVMIDRPPTTGGERVFRVVCAHAWRSGTPLHEVIGDIVGSPAHFAGLASEKNGLGEYATQELFRLMEQRPRIAGGGRRRRFAVIDPFSSKTWQEQIDEQSGVRRPPCGRRTRRRRS
jgi:hypothetical protein